MSFIYDVKKCHHTSKSTFRGLARAYNEKLFQIKFRP